MTPGSDPHRPDEAGSKTGCHVMLAVPGTTDCMMIANPHAAELGKLRNLLIRKTPWEPGAGIRLV
eukprot:8350380-Pyramimonas_sp.AAC.1